MIDLAALTSALTEEQKLDLLTEHLTRDHLDFAGGYPYDFGWIGDTLAVAELDHDGATQLSTYTRTDLLSWFDRAARMAAEDCGTENAEHYLHETKTP